MKKYLSLLIVAILFSFQSFSQSRDLPTLESLKKQVPKLKDIALVNCLNLIAYNFDIIGFGPTPADFIRRSDSIFHYADLAFAEAKKINYSKGMVNALNQLASSQNIKGFGLRMSKQNDSAAKSEQAKFVLVAISLAKKINYDDGLGNAFELKNELDTAIDLFHKAGDEKREGEVCTWKAEGYLRTGFYENAFEYCQRGLKLNQQVLTKAKTKEEQGWRNYLYQQSLSDMASLYDAAGDYQTSLEYLNVGEKFGKAYETGWTMEKEKAAIFRLLGQYDSAFVYLGQRKIKSPYNAWTNLSLGQTFLAANEIDSALFFLQKALMDFRKTNNGYLAPTLLDISGAYIGKKDFNSALTYTREGMFIANKKARPLLMRGYELLSKIHHGLGNNDSAYFYLSKYIALKDSIQNRQFLFRLNNSKKLAEDAKKESQIGFLNRDNKIKEQQLKQQSTIKNSLIAIFIAFVLIGFFVYRNLSLKKKNEMLLREGAEEALHVQQLENEKKHAELLQRATELEMQALRAQMNPHFIFNCLSSINRFIFINETKTASDYLTRFSRLIRMVLLHSQKKLVALEDELEMLRLYLDMERMRFKNAFDYHITTTNAVESSPIFIPPLLLQPFCENAIWHGLMHLTDRSEVGEATGHLNIELHEEENILHCIITDNGVGREKAATFKSKSAEKDKSLGLKITKERLSLLNQGKTGGTFYEIEDLKDEQGNAAGTRVKLQIRYKESVGEFA